MEVVMGAAEPLLFSFLQLVASSSGTRAIARVATLKKANRFIFLNLVIPREKVLRTENSRCREIIVLCRGKNDLHYFAHKARGCLGGYGSL